jgi:hypothetical protein
VVIVNQPFVDSWFEGRSPLGRRIKLIAADSSEPAQWREIIGVVPDLGFSPGDRTKAEGIYVPLPDRTSDVFIAIRSAGNPATTAGPLRKIIATIDSKTEVRSIRLLEDAGREQTSFLTALTSAMTALGMMALLMSIVSIYALLSFMVTRRTREIGIRVALGATSRQVLQSITGGAMLYLAIGGIIGTVIGLASLRIQDVLLVSIPAANMSMPSTIFATLAIAGGVACWIPARRALGIRPSEALNAD